MMQFALLTACLTVCAMPLWAEEVLSQATGNWGGTDNGGFYFRAELTQNATTARLRIWNALDGIPQDGAAQFDKIENGQRLEVLTAQGGTVLQVITEFADEAYEGSVTVDIQYLDNQFTVIGYHHHDVAYQGRVAFDCDADLWNGTVTANGVTSDLPPRDFEALNASGWTYTTARERGICPGLD
jgi:hypothetical protein